MDKIKGETIDFEKTKAKLVSFLESKESSVMVLSTSAKNIVMSRNVLIICKFPDIYFFTWKHSRKCRQIEKNNLVSLCSNKVEIEGTAEMLGNMTSEENREILEIIREKQPGAVEKWEKKPNMIIVRVRPLFACVDGYFDNDDAFLEYIDFKNQNAYKIKWGYY